MNITEERYNNIKNIAEEVSIYYQNELYNKLKDIEADLEKNIDSIVKSHVEEYKLIYQNDSSNEIKLYEISGRVKEKDSLKEKIVRDQLYFILNEANKNEYINILKNNMDDLIGLRYLMSLTFDCKQMYELILNYKDEFKVKGIKFNDLENNPQVMKNGRRIYRIKGEYEDYKFELQIKSKIDSAWADIEHMLFYKNFNFSYIQGTNKKVMNKIGGLLEKIDDLMLQVRESQDEYDEKVDDMDFSQYLRKRYVDLMRNKLGSSYILTEYRNSIFRMFKVLKPETRDRVLSLKDYPKENNIVEFEYDEDCVNSNIYINYLNMKQLSIEFSVFESMYYEWISCEEKSFRKIDEISLTKYLELLFKCLSEEREYKIKNFNDWITSKTLEILKSNLIDNHCKFFFFDKDKMDMLYSFWRASYIDFAYEWEEFKEYDIDIFFLEKIILRYLLDNEDTIDKYALEITNYLKEVDLEKLYDFCFNELKNKIDKYYSENIINSSGKIKKDNLIIILIQRVSKEMEKSYV